MPKPTTRPARDSRRWRRAAMSNPLCRAGSSYLVLSLLTIAGVLLLLLLGGIITYSAANSPQARQYLVAQPTTLAPHQPGL